VCTIEEIAHVGILVLYIQLPPLLRDIKPQMYRGHDLDLSHDVVGHVTIIFAEIPGLANKNWILFRRNEYM